MHNGIQIPASAEQRRKAAALKKTVQVSVHPTPPSFSQVRHSLTLTPVINSAPIPHAPTPLSLSSALFPPHYPPQQPQASAKARRSASIHGVLRGREVEVLQEEPEQRQPARPGSRRSRRRELSAEEIVQHEGRPGDRPARERCRRRRGGGGGRVRAAAVVLEPVRGPGEGAAGALLHHAPLRDHARLLEGLLVAAVVPGPAAGEEAPPLAVSPSARIRESVMGLLKQAEGHGGRRQIR